MVFSAEGFCWPDQTLAVISRSVLCKISIYVPLAVCMYRSSILKLVWVKGFLILEVTYNSVDITQLIASYFFVGFIGYAPEVYELVWDHKVDDVDDDQLYYTKLFLDQDVRVRFCLLEVGWYFMK